MFYCDRGWSKASVIVASKSCGMPGCRHHGIANHCPRESLCCGFSRLLHYVAICIPNTDQKAIRIARLLAEEVVPVIGVLQVLLWDQGTNLLAHVMLYICSLGITKLNTTVYHPQCNGMVECMNHTIPDATRACSELIKCNCKSPRGCNRCKCVKAGLTCTDLCNCTCEI